MMHIVEWFTFAAVIVYLLHRSVPGEQRMHPYPVRRPDSEKR